MSLTIFGTSGGIAMTNAYVVADDETKQAVLFDAPDHTVGSLLDEIEKRGLMLVGLWLTHGHFDHIVDHKVVTTRFPAARVLIHPLDEPKLQAPGSQMFMLPFEIPPRSADGFVNEGDELSLGENTFNVLHTPGHSPGHVMYYCAAKKLLVGGDLIVGGSVGRTDLPDSDHEQLEASVKRVMALPDDVQLLPGHGQPTTIGDERRTNRMVRSILRHAT